MIKITKSNSVKIHDALHAVNGRARAHTFTEFFEIDRLAGDAEKRLDDLGIPKVCRAGAVYRAKSGERLPSAYRYSAIATSVILIRRSAGWYLDAVAEGEIWGGSKSDNGTLTLTAEQDAIAVEKLRLGYSVAPTMLVKIAV